MSAFFVENALQKFLENPTPEVICISGSWGVGKTYLWSQCLARYGCASFKDYSYVSLFGQNNIQDARSAIVENLRSIEEEGADSVPSFVVRQGKKLSSLVARLKDGAKGVIPDGVISISERMLFATIGGIVVCFDDLERGGEDLSPADILGLANELKEQKGCKVIILLNTAELGEREAEFSTQIERVADKVLELRPTSEEAALIGVGNDTPKADFVRETVVALSIKNIRTISRIGTVCLELHDLLEGFDSRIYEQAIRTAALFSFARYEPNLAPSREYIRQFNRYVAAEERVESKAAWKLTLENYDFRYDSALDRAIEDGIFQGYFEVDYMQQHASDIERRLALEDKDGSFHEAWELYHHSFDENEEKVVDAIYHSFKSCVQAISLLNFNGAIKLLKDLGQSDKATELIEYYVTNKIGEFDFWDLNETPFGPDIDDEDVRKAIQSKHEQLAPPAEDPVAILLRISKSRGWSTKDVRELSKLTADEFYQLFKNLRGKNMRRITTEALRFASRGEKGSDEQRIALTANEALDRISNESRINARRVKQHRSRV